MVTRTALREQVRKALLDLYDYERLRDLPLTTWLGAQPGYTGKGTLHQILVDAIAALRPGPDTPADAASWRTYQILFYRFVQGMGVAEVASQLGFGERHFRRQQARAVLCLADLLWEQLQAQGMPADEPVATTALPSQDDVGANLAWLQSERAPQQVALADVLAGVEDVLTRLVSAQGVHLDVDIPRDLPPLSIHPQALRQILANALAYLVGQVPGGRIQMSATPQERAVCLRMVPIAGKQVSPGAPRGPEALDISHRLLAMYNGTLDVLPPSPEQPQTAPGLAIHVPFSRRLPVLIVDDNPDTATLFARYLAESRFQPAIAHSGREALTLAQESAPAAIVLDVMMPEQDGWEVLSLLKTHPLTEATPVIVATILTDRDLALSLGAADFLHKPVTQAELLAALDRLVG